MTAAPTRKYNPGFLTDDELVSSFCVRTHEFESLVEALSECTGDSNQHQIVIGPRGSGKTSLLLRVAAEVRRDADLAARFFPIVFAEESYEVSTAGEFWLECLARLADQAPEREDAPDLHATLVALRAIQDDQMLGERCLAALLDFADRESKRLVLMVENLNMMFRDMMDRDAGWRLRKILQNEPRIILLASATSRFNEIDHPDHALYDQFRVLTLRPLDTAECAALWETVAGQSRPTNTIRSLEILTGGSPRLLAIVARFGAGLSFRNLMDKLLDLVDDHTEYFKSHLESLPAQERRVYLALAELWKPAFTKEIAERARLETSKCSAHLARLIERGVVRLDGGSARRKQYYLSERMYNIYYLLRRGKDRLVKVLIQFMASYYSPGELKEIGTRIAREVEDVVPEMRSLYQYASTELMATSTGMHKPEKGDLAEPARLAQQMASALVNRGAALAALNRHGEALAASNEALRRMSDLAEPARLAQQMASALVNRGAALAALNRHGEALAASNEALRRMSDLAEPARLAQQMASALVNRSAALAALNRHGEALAASNEALRRMSDLAEPARLAQQMASALVNRGAALAALNRHGEALAASNEALRRMSDLAEPARLAQQAASAYVNRDAALAALNRHEEALRRMSDLAEPARLAQQAASAYVNRGAALAALNRHGEALAASNEALRRMSDLAEPARLAQQAASAYVNRGAALAALNRHGEALAASNKVLRWFGESDVPELREQAASALVNKSIVLAELGRSARPRDVAGLLEALPKLDLREKAIRALLTLSIGIGPERMCELIQASRAGNLLRPLTMALERDMGLDPRVPEEVSEVAEDIRRDLAKIREARRGRVTDALSSLQRDATRRGLDQLTVDEIDEEIQAVRKGRKDS